MIVGTYDRSGEGCFVLNSKAFSPVPKAIRRIYVFVVGLASATRIDDFG